MSLILKKCLVYPLGLLAVSCIVSSTSRLAGVASCVWRALPCRSCAEPNFVFHLHFSTPNYVLNCLVLIANVGLWQFKLVWALRISFLHEIFLSKAEVPNCYRLNLLGKYSSTHFYISFFDSIIVVL